VKKKTTAKKTKAKQKPTANTATLVKRVLFRPDRFSYVREKKHEGCVFCDAAKSAVSFDTLCVFKSKFSMILLNKFPYNSGHLLVVPQAHKGHLLSLSTEEYQDLHETLRLAIKATETIYQPAALNIGVNHGKAAGAGIPEHLHYHLIPRWEADLNFFPLIAETKAVVESLDQTYRKFIDYFVGRTA
jgi:ATP adenylyltransferase